jgi:hypothetical protein
MSEEKKYQRKIIDVPLWVKKELSIEAIKKGYDGLKAYIEDILIQKAKELKK